MLDAQSGQSLIAEDQLPVDDAGKLHLFGLFAGDKITHCHLRIVGLHLKVGTMHLESFTKKIAGKKHER